MTEATTAVSPPTDDTPIAVSDRIEVRLEPGSRVLICSDLHLSGEPTRASRLVTAELIEVLSSMVGPAAVVFNGDCFELLASPETTVSSVLDAHQALETTLRDFAGNHGRVVIVTVGNHDGRLAWDPAELGTLQERVGAKVSLVVDLLVETEHGLRVVRVEHGHRFDPANAFHDPRDPYDSPFGHHVVQEVLPELIDRPFIGDVAWLSDPNQFPQFLGSRVVYRELVGRAWWLALPFLAALLIRTPIVVRGLSDARGTQEIARWLFVAGVGVILDVIVLGALAVLLARRTYRALASTRLGSRGAHQNDPPRVAGAALCANGFAGFVTGHTHHPELTPLGEGFYANSGCGVQSVEPRRARFGLPPVFAGVLRRSWIELETGRDLEARLIVAESPLRETTFERLAARRAARRPSVPTVVSSVPGSAGWPVDASVFESMSRRDRTRRLAAGLVVGVAAVATLSAVTPPLLGRLRFLLEAMPVELPQVASASLVFSSFGLVVLARGLRRGHRLAWMGSLGLLVVSAGLHLLKGADIEEAVLASLIAGWLALRRDAFPVKPDTTAVRRSAVLVGGLGSLAVVGSVVLVAAIGAHRRVGVHESIRTLADRLAGNRTSPLPAGSAFVVPALIAATIASVMVAIWFVFGPRQPPRRSSAEHHVDRERARRVVEEYGGDTLSYFALRDDKDWFFTGGTVIAYAVRNGVCLVSPDPIGPATEWAAAWGEFMAFADRQGWSTAVVGAQPGWLPVYEAAGMQPVYIGEEAVVDCQSFSLEGGAMKGLRGAYNRVSKAGYRAIFVDPTTIDAGLATDLRQLVGEGHRGAAERGFSMTLSRIFDPEDTGLLLSVVIDPANRPVAICQWVPAPDIEGWSLDIMRRRDDPELPNGITDFLVLKTIEHVRSEHKWGLCLNFAAMRSVANADTGGDLRELQRRVLRTLSETMQIESLGRYNEKYQPYWRPRYVLLDAVERAATEGMAIADAESLWELPVIGRFLGRA